MTNLLVSRLIEILDAYEVQHATALDYACNIAVAAEDVRAGYLDQADVRTSLDHRLKHYASMWPDHLTEDHLDQLADEIHQELLKEPA